MHTKESLTYNSDTLIHTFVVTKEDENKRLDLYLNSLFSEYTRNFLQQLIEKGLVTLNQKNTVKQSIKIKESDTITIQFPPQQGVDPEKLKTLDNHLSIVYEHNDFFIVNKPAGLLVHQPHANSTELTLVDWLLQAHNPIKIDSIGLKERAGIVHRLDKDTSGLIIIARTPHAFKTFQEMFAQRTIYKTYYALVEGHPPREGTVDQAIGRDPYNRTKMAIKKPTDRMIARTATTHYKTITYFQNYSLLELKPITGRTHQIRVHLRHIGHPIVGDSVYGKKSNLINRQALHAQAISFTFDGIFHSISIPLAPDIQAACDLLEPSCTSLAI